MTPRKPQTHKQYEVQPNVFDAYNEQTPIQTALGSERATRKQEASDIRSVNWVPGVSGWRLTPRGLELGDTSGIFPPGTITFTDIQNIATDKILGRDTAGSGVIEQLGLGAGLAISGGNLNNTITQYTDENSQDAIGAMLDASLTYIDATPLLGITPAYKRKSLFDHFSSVGNVGTGEDTLYSDTIAASQLAINGEKLNAEYGGTFVSSATASRELKVYFGGTMIFDSGALTLSLSAAWTMYVTIIRVSASVIRYMISMTTEGAALAAYTAVGELTGLTLSNTNILKITGEAAGVGAATDDIVAMMGSIEWLAAA